MTKKPLKIVCHSFRTILEIKNFDPDELATVVKVVKRKVGEYEDSPSTHAYMHMIAKIFLVDPMILDTMVEEVKNSDDPDAEDKLSEALDDIYIAITNWYPNLSIEIILLDLNLNSDEKLREDLTEELLGRWGMGLETAAVAAKEKVMPTKRSFSSMDEVLTLKKYLKRKVIGQDEAINTITNAIKLVGAGLESHASFFFLGPTGVGKTYISKILGKRYSGNFCKINCSEYSSQHEYSKLLGAPPGYVSSTEGGVLSKKAAKSNAWVFVFDEIEKGHEKLHDLLLNLLDEGKVDDNKGETLDFTKSIFICTSNVGLKDIKRTSVGFTNDTFSYNKESFKEEIKKSIHRNFKDEFINRFDEWVYFNQLTEDDILKIASLELTNLPIEKTPALLKYIATNGYSDRYGARELKRFIKKNVTLKVADSILCNEIPVTGKKYTPTFNSSGELEIINTKQEKEVTYGLDGSEEAEDFRAKRKVTTKEGRRGSPKPAGGGPRRKAKTKKKASPKEED